MVQGHGFDAPLGSLPHRRSHTGDWGSVSLGSVPTLSTQQGTPEGAMGGARGRGILGPEPQDSHRKRTAAVGTASAGPGRNGRLSMPQVRSTLRSPTDSRGDSLPDTSMHLSHAHPPPTSQRSWHPQGPQRTAERTRTGTRCAGGDRKETKVPAQSLCRPRKCGPRSATTGVVTFSVGGRPALSAQTHILDRLLGEGALLTDTQGPHIG